MMRMKKMKLVILLVLLIPLTSMSKELGVSFSYLFPKNGYFSSPVAPLAIRGVGVKMGDFMSLGTGVSWYNIAGVQVIELEDFDPVEPTLGPLTTFLFPLELSLKVPLGKNRIEFIGGGFLFFNATSRLNSGNLDRELRAYEDWQVLNGDYEMTNHLGMGYDFGAQLVIYVKRNLAITIKGMYMIGGMPIDLRGTYEGINELGEYESKSFEFTNSKMDITGWELRVGALFAGK